MARFNVLRPVYEKTGEVEHHTVEGRSMSIAIERVRRWHVVGPANSVEDAKARYAPVQYGYALVLEDAAPRLDLRNLADSRPQERS